VNGSFFEGKLTIRGRRIDESDIYEIREVVSEYVQHSRSRIAREGCRRWQWRQTNGSLKVRACLDVLNELERRGWIDLPPRRKGVPRPPSGTAMRNASAEVIPACVNGELAAHLPLRIEPVEGPDESRLWRSLIDRYHYLGCRELVGAQLRYFVYNRTGELLAALGWQSGVRHLACRDYVIGWNETERMKYLEHVANNVRYLILPWVQIPNAASAILSSSIRHLKRDWRERYGVDLWLLETFVDRALFEGTCYRAANWVAIGSTKGYGRKAGRFVYHGKPKEVYVYVLNPGMRRIICHQKTEPRLTREFLLSTAAELDESNRRTQMKYNVTENWDPKSSPSFNLDPKDLDGLKEDFLEYHGLFEEAFGRKEQVCLSQRYLQGLMSPVKRKNVEAMALHLEGPGQVRGLQRFMTSYKWSEEGMKRRHQEETAKTLATPDGVLSIDASETGKKGRESVGVAHQYCGNLGKTANCQSGVYACYTGEAGYALLEGRLYMPQCWFTEEYAARREKCRVPAGTCFQTKLAIANEMVEAIHASKLFPIKWITCDASFGNSKTFLEQLPQGLKYMADISSTRKVWPVAVPNQPDLETEGSCVSELLNVAGLLDWKHRKVAEGEKGPIVSDFARIRVYVSEQRHPEDERWLWLCNREGGEIKYVLSNAPVEEDFEEMVRVSACRWPIERCFQEGKGELGMDHYEHRSWPAWHRHMLMVRLAQLFLLRMRLKYKKSTRLDPTAVL
jgi:SRSO17 transposase